MFVCHLLKQIICSDVYRLLRPILFIEYKFTIIKVQNYTRKGIFFHQKSMISSKYGNRIPFCQKKILFQGISQSIFAVE